MSLLLNSTCLNENVNETYDGREQTQAKHFILKSYLQALAFKILNQWDELTYVDGFSGPWHSRMEDFSDTSFMIAIEVLREAQSYFRERGEVKTIRCFLVEKEPVPYKQLTAEVAKFHMPENRFLVKTRGGLFEEAVPEIVDFVGQSFSLVFIDPTGWTGYPYDKITPLLRHKPGEVLINFMYDFINRFASSADKTTEDSLAPILGGSGWKNRLDPNLTTGAAVEKLFREELKRVGEFEFVTSTCIQKSTVDRPHFFIAYGTRSGHGLVAFREVEWGALRKHEQNRLGAKLRKREKATGTPDLFDKQDLPKDQSVQQIVDEQKKWALNYLLQWLEEQGGRAVFSDVRLALMEPCMLRETNVKDICVDLARQGILHASWKQSGSRRQKPNLNDVIALIN